MPHRLVETLDKEQEELKQRLVENMITASTVDPHFVVIAAGQEVYCSLPTEEQIEEAMIAASFSASGQSLDPIAREPRFRRFLLAKCVVRVADVLFEDGDEPLVRKFLGDIPQIIFEQIWSEFLLKRETLLMMLAGADDVIKKSLANRAGGEDGDSSANG